MMRSIRMSWYLINIIVLSFTFSSLSEAQHEKKLPSAVVVGTVYCDTCFQEHFSKTSHFISGALVAVECRGTRSSTPSFHKEVKTNEHGEFKVHLPFSVTKQAKKIKKCSVKLISSSEPHCAVASTSTSSSLHLKSRKQETHIFSAGFFTFKPPKQPKLCKAFNSKKYSTQLSSGMVSQQQIFSPIPQIPLIPSLPPPFGIIPLPPNPLQPPSIVPPNPLLPPPPSILPPNPLQPPPSIFPPNPFQPSPPLFPPILPPIPVLTPPSPPPPAIPFIPLPPGFPGIPPASSLP
ncbi:hypothetical protein ACSBR2_022842 [Camellia fascicularis]